jgi:hypothetical protein
VAEPLAHLERLRTQRRELHETPIDPLAEDDIEALAVDLFDCRQEAIDHRTRLRSLRPSGSVPDRQQTLQTVADEVEWYTVRLEELGKRGTVEDPLMLWADCRHCHHRITCIDDDRGVWMHCAINGMPLAFWGGRGCRAASFDRDGDWNDALPRGKYATPKRGTMTHVVPLFIGH